MARSPAPLEPVLDALEHHHGRQHAVGPSDPYEMILFLNCGYPPTDTSCHKGFAALKRNIGVTPDEILAAPDAALAALMRLGGIMPAQRAERLRSIALAVKRECHGDLRATLSRRMRADTQHPDVGVRDAKRLLQQFPTIGEPGAEKILLFARLAPVAAVPSAFVAVPVRLWHGETGSSYSADYRRGREILSRGVPESFAARQRAYMLLKAHGRDICKREAPRCEVCPVTGQCAYLRARAAD